VGKITVQMELTNFADQVLADRGYIQPEEVRQLSIPDAVVDTGATTLSLPISLIEQLGLEEVGTTVVRTANGSVRRGVFRGARVEIMGRDSILDVVELPVGFPTLIGYIVLERLDLYPDPVNRTLTGRPDSPDHMVIECYNSDTYPHPEPFAAKSAG